jgi:hypothetical protein
MKLHYPKHRYPYHPTVQDFREELESRRVSSKGSVQQLLQRIQLLNLYNSGCRYFTYPDNPDNLSDKKLISWLIEESYDPGTNPGSEPESRKQLISQINAIIGNYLSLSIDKPKRIFKSNDRYILREPFWNYPQEDLQLWMNQEGYIGEFSKKEMIDVIRRFYRNKGSIGINPSSACLILDVNRMIAADDYQNFFNFWKEFGRLLSDRDKIEILEESGCVSGNIDRKYMIAIDFEGKLTREKGWGDGRWFRTEGS